MASCDSLFGLGLINSYMTDPVEICNSGTSTITCYTHKQQHKAVEDTFCVGTNIVIDFSKVHGEHQATKPPRGVAQYHSFDSSSTTADCKNTANFPTTKFMPHHTLQMNSFKDQTPTSTDATRESTTTYLLARDEDFENAFHSSADFLNMELVYQGLNLNKDDTQVVLLDRNPDGPFFEMIQNAFTTPNKPLKRAANYNNKKIVFDKVVWHLESPAGIVFPKVGNNGATGCHNEYLYSKYRQRVLSAFDLWDVPPPTVPSLTLIVRKRTSSKNVGRILKNEQEVVNVMKECVLCDVRVVDLATLSYREQIKTIRESNVIIGVHGAGLMNIIFAAEEAVLLEMHPHYRLDRHFRHSARLSGKHYMPLRSTEPVTCEGTSDNVPIPINEFRSALDGAVRLARGFDNGLSECGSNCPLSILALDDGHNGDYARLGLTKAQRPDTKFPC